MPLLDLQKPEATTVIRWVLRAILVVFLAWLVRRRPDQDEEEEEEVQDVRRPAAKPRSANARSAPRIQPRPGRDPYPPSSVRQRRPVAGGDGALDFDDVINKMSKPKEMWEVRKEGSAPHILPRGESGEGLRPTKIPTGPRPLREAADNHAGAAARGKESVLRGHERPVTMIAWNRDGNLLFTCGKDKIVCVWSFPEGEQLGTYEGHQGAVWCCSVTADSRWLVTSGADRLVIVWEARTSRELARVELPGVVRFVEWAGGTGAGATAPTSERFATCHNRFGAHPPAVTVWRFDGSAIEELLRISTLPTAACQVRWGRGDYFVASAHDNGELVFWRSDTGTEVKRLKAHDQGISRFDFNGDRELVATVSHDMSVKIWDVGKGSDWSLLYTVTTDRALNAVAFGPLTHAGALGEPSKRPDKVCVICAGGQDARDVALSGTATEQFGTLLFRLGKDPTPCSLEADGVTKGHFGPVHTLAFARDGSAIASGSEDGCVRIHHFEVAQVSSAA